MILEWELEGGGHNLPCALKTRQRNHLWRDVTELIRNAKGIEKNEGKEAANSKNSNSTKKTTQGDESKDELGFDDAKGAGKMTTVSREENEPKREKNQKVLLDSHAKVWE